MASRPSARVIRSNVSGLVAMARRSIRRAPAPERHAYTALQIAQSPGPPCPGGRNLREPLGEGLPGTGRVEAAEPPCLETQRHRAALPWQISEAALVVAVNAP